MKSIFTEGNELMKEHYDFTNAKRGPVAPAKGKSRITIMLDDTVLQAARERADEQGIGYQTLINGLLRQVLIVDNKRDATEKCLLGTGDELSVTAFNRREVEALEVQLNSMASSLHELLSDHSKASST